LVAGCSKGWGGRCADDACLFSRDDWRTISSLANVSSAPPPLDSSNRLLTSALVDPDVWARVQAAASFEEVPDSLRPTLRFGWHLYHDPRLSGDGSKPADSIGRPTVAPRSTGQIRVSCATCHDPALYGADLTSQPPNVSNGAGYYDVNGQQTLNVARFAPVFYWNGRTDSLWSQAAQVMESGVSMNGHRDKTFWIVSRCYGSDPDFAATLAALEPDPMTHDATAAKIAALSGDMEVASPATATTVAFKDAYAAAVKQHPELQGLAARVHVDAAKAIALYEWFLTSDHSRFDRFVKEGPDSGQLTAAEKRGLKLFIGHAGCVTCHNTPLFSDGSFHNIGIGQSGDHVPTIAACEETGSPSCNCAPTAASAGDAGVDAGGGDASDAGDGAPPVVAPQALEGAGAGGTCLPVGAYAGVQKLHAGPVASSPSTTVFRRCSCYDDSFSSSACGVDEVEASDMPTGAEHGCNDPGTPGYYPDAGAVKPPERWLGAWRTPSLRDVAKTAPYMHTGVYATLADVVWHYDQATTAEGSGTSELSPLNLTDQDRSDLVAFLETLTGVSGPPALVKPPLASDYEECPAIAGGTADGGADGSADATSDAEAGEASAEATDADDAASASDAAGDAE
jgi:cytochrome c peroxidase